MSSTLERHVVTLGGARVGAGPAVVIAGRISLRARPAARPQDALPAARSHDARPAGRSQDARPVGRPQDALPAARPHDARTDGWPPRESRGGPAGRVPLVEPAGADDLPAVAAGADGVVIGASWTRDIPLVRAAAALGLPVVVERRPSASLEEWLGLADYCALEGRGEVILCETGRLDLGLLRAAREASGRPVVADVTGRPELSAAAVAAGADGLVLGGLPAARGAHAAEGGDAYGHGGGDDAYRHGGEAYGHGGGDAYGHGGGGPYGADVVDPEELRAAREAVTLVGALLRPERPATLPECREAIDRVDAALATLLERRAALAGVVQTLKPVGGFAGRDMERERSLVARMARRAPALGEERLASVMNAVIEAGLHLAEERRRA
ncbi:bifunctional 3-deoxy-7-phosphoheptulonate synthase/chorismate mutase type II [Nonomuraea sp. SMC257]|uniref:Bifunctional 3-deoxy-7-phosphoheptulonate synthase/chorismate mutase type II n=1 Tax=Nonomuraea montanisoli TaxID=2741721 RepID=A0A7Y6M2J2_9ACTN|nr:chorismate mutase [Nonomuraea montanisoli]NUW31219.1 bifunctional 3-deoxy-7-phosphoheptulonate synthase/chorismate mutase type II [Nonomuraea montanisoli]